MTSYKEPFSKAWSKLLKTELFPKLLNNIQPIQLNIHVGYGWDWLSKVPADGTIITLDITKEEISQCNYSDTLFNCYVNFGKGYKFLEIPYTSIESIIIGSKTNWIGNPINTLPFNLNEATINYLNNINLEKYLEEEENDQLESID